MKTSRFTESQIVACIQKQEAGIPVKEICRDLGISEPTFYNWKAKLYKEINGELSKSKMSEALFEENEKFIKDANSGDPHSGNDAGRAVRHMIMKSENEKIDKQINVNSSEISNIEKQNETYQQKIKTYTGRYILESF